MLYLFNTDIADKSLAVSEIGTSHNKRFHKFGPVLRKKYILHYVFSGYGQYNGMPIHAGEGFLIVPNELQTLESFDDPWFHYWIMFDGKKAEELLLQCGIPLTAHKFTIQNPQRVLLVFQKAMETKLSGHSQDLYFTSVFYELLSLQNVTTVARTSLTESAKDFIEINIYRKLTVEDIAAQCNVSAKHLCKLFQKNEGISPLAYLQKKKFLVAKDLLLSTQLPVNEIAAAIGYDDPCYFSTAFRKHVGVSPREFREQQKLGE